MLPVSPADREPSLSITAPVLGPRWLSVSRDLCTLEVLRGFLPMVSSSTKSSKGNGPTPRSEEHYDRGCDTLRRWECPLHCCHWRPAPQTLHLPPGLHPLGRMLLFHLKVERSGVRSCSFWNSLSLFCSLPLSQQRPFRRSEHGSASDKSRL